VALASAFEQLLANGGDARKLAAKVEQQLRELSRDG
jgi:hypothetical protein